MKAVASPEATQGAAFTDLAFFIWLCGVVVSYCSCLVLIYDEAWATHFGSFAKMPLRIIVVNVNVHID